MVEANPTVEATNDAATPTDESRPPKRTLLVSSNNFIHLNEGNIKTFYKISSCIGRGKSHLSNYHQSLNSLQYIKQAHIGFLPCLIYSAL